MQAGRFAKFITFITFGLTILQLKVNEKFQNMYSKYQQMSSFQPAQMNCGKKLVPIIGKLYT